MKTSTVTQKGQITIPKEFRDLFGWTQDTRVAFFRNGDGVKIVTDSESASSVVSKMRQADWKGPSADELIGETRSEK